MAKKSKDALTRAIEGKQRIIARRRAQIRDIRSYAESQIASIDKKIAREQVLLDALQRGALKP